MYRTTTRDWQGIRQAIQNGEAFKTHGALWGYSGGRADLYLASGHLPREYWESVNHATYVIMSYETPIAWCGRHGGWHQPDLKYSVTTTRHQHTAALAVDWL